MRHYLPYLVPIAIATLFWLMGFFIGLDSAESDSSHIYVPYYIQEPCPEQPEMFL